MILAGFLLLGLGGAVASPKSNLGVFKDHADVFVSYRLARP